MVIGYSYSGRDIIDTLDRVWARSPITDWASTVSTKDSGPYQRPVSDTLKGV